MKALKYTVKFVNDNVLHDYAGMNHFAAQALGFDYPIGRFEIFIDPKLPKRTVIKNIIHEIAEAERMASNPTFYRKNYFTAHKYALRMEDQSISAVYYALSNII